MLNITTSSCLVAIGPGAIYNKSFQGNFNILLLLLTSWLLVFSLAVNKCNSYGLLLHQCLSLCVALAVKTKSILLFYIFFELSAVPIALIIFYFGYQPEKLQASLFLVMYTVVRSLPLLLFLVFGAHCCSLAPIAITLVFIVKTPLYLLHTWLPKAHLEAPVGGSIVLAGVLLKLGAYGLVLFLPKLKICFLLSTYLILSLVGSIRASLTCLRQGDMKLLIAYSSVVHIGVTTVGFLSATEVGYNCGVMIAMRHGLCSPFLFAFSFWLYERTHSRLFVNRMSKWPVLMRCLLVLIRINQGVPVGLGFWSEVCISVAVLSLSIFFIPLLLLAFLVSCVYNLYLYVSCIHTKITQPIYIDNIRVAAVIHASFLCYSTFLCLDLFVY